MRISDFPAHFISALEEFQFFAALSYLIEYKLFTTFSLIGSYRSAMRQVGVEIKIIVLTWDKCDVCLTRIWHADDHVKRQIFSRFWYQISSNVRYPKYKSSSATTTTTTGWKYQNSQPLKRDWNIWTFSNHTVDALSIQTIVSLKSLDEIPLN